VIQRRVRWTRTNFIRDIAIRDIAADAIGIQSVLRHTAWLRTGVCYLPILDLQGPMPGWLGSAFKINIEPIWRSTKLRLALLTLHI